jgi:hypothetical protein
MRPNRLKLFQAIGEAGIPLLGYFVFDWSLYFILLFYFIDLVSTEVFTYLKVNRIIKHQGIGYAFRQRFTGLLINTVIVLALLASAHLFIHYQQEGIDFVDAIIAFINYEEPGLPLPQGYILLPLVVFGNYQQYKTFFIQTNAFKVLSWKKLMLSRRRALIIALLGAFLAVGIVQFAVLPDLLYLVLILLIKFYIDVKKTP